MPPVFEGKLQVCHHEGAIMSIDTTQSPFTEVIRTGPYQIRFPKRDGLDQDEEWCEVEIDGVWKRVRFHDYDVIYRIPGLYETIFYRTLRCTSPTVVNALLRVVLLERAQKAEELCVLDFGAGNGMAGEALQTLGIRRIFGVDILPEAQEAALRDRPWVYNDYFVTDLNRWDPAVRLPLEAANINTLVTVAALGFGDIPVRAFYNAFNLIQEPGWVAFNIKEDFLDDGARGGFAGLIGMMRRRGILRIDIFKRYCHRLAITGESLFYIAVVARKLKDIPPELLAQVEHTVR